MARVGLFLCECGPNIAEAMDLDRVQVEAIQDRQVAGVERHRLLCSEAGQQFVSDRIREQGYDRVVIAACSPKQHEATFAAVLAKLGMNPEMLQMVNIREQCAWSTPDKAAATDKATRLVRAALDRVRFHEPLELREIECNPDVLVIGGGIAGIEVALRTAQPGRRVYLVEQGELGGMLAGRQSLFPGMKPAAGLLEPRLKRLRENRQIEVFESSRLGELLGFFGSYVARIETEGGAVERRAGAVVLATGACPAGPEGLDRYGYGRVTGVHTSDEFERSGIRKLKSVAIVHCAGRERLGYCSQLCCANSMKIARQVKTALPEADVVEFYRDLCLPGKEYDRFQRETEGTGVRFVRVDDVTVEEDSGRPVVRFQEPGKEEASGDFDAVVLATGLAAEPGNAELAEMLDVELDEHGFFKEEHQVLNPVAATSEGVFIAGCAQGPAGLRDTIARAAAVAGKILAALVPGRKLQLEARTSEVSPVMCVGCGVCVTNCTYGALTLDQSMHVAVVNEVLCRGCGNCAAACPSGAARHRHFTNTQLSREVNEILK
jgi:heterodisulfide reductase subunit A